MAKSALTEAQQFVLSHMRCGWTPNRCAGYTSITLREPGDGKSTRFGTCFEIKIVATATWRKLVHLGYLAEHPDKIYELTPKWWNDKSEELVADGWKWCGCGDLFHPDESLSQTLCLNCSYAEDLKRG